MKKVYEIGPDKDLKGGISTIIRNISSSEKINSLYDISYISTTSNRKIGNFIKSIFKIMFIEKESIAHFHIASNGSFLRKYILYKLLKRDTKKIFHLHGGGFISFYNSSHKFVKWTVNDMLNGCDLIVNVSEYMNIEMINTFPKIKCKTIKLYNGTYINDNIKQLEEKENIILFLGKIAEYKGVYDLVDAVKILREFLVHNKYKVIVAGNGEEEKIKRIIVSEHLNNIIDIVGWVDGSRKEELLSNSKIVLIPSHIESFGITAIEAMSYGNAIVATNVGGLPEIVKENINGFIVKKGDYSDMAEKIKKIITNNKLLANIYKNNIIDCNKFSIEEMIKRYIDIYEML